MCKTLRLYHLYAHMVRVFHRVIPKVLKTGVSQRDSKASYPHFPQFEENHILC